MDEGGEDVRFIDAESYSGGQDKKITFRLIILEHLRKILNLSCCEWHGGFEQTRVKPIGGTTVTEYTYIQDSREKYGNAVDSLHDVLYPHFDEIMTKESEEHEKELEQIYEDSHYQNDRNEKKFDKQNYRQQKVEYKRKLFRNLNCFLKRNKYMEGKVFEEEV